MVKTSKLSLDTMKIAVDWAWFNMITAQKMGLKNTLRQFRAQRVSKSLWVCALKPKFDEGNPLKSDRID